MCLQCSHKICKILKDSGERDKKNGRNKCYIVRILLQFEVQGVNFDFMFLRNSCTKIVYKISYFKRKSSCHQKIGFVSLNVANVMTFVIHHNQTIFCQ